MAQANAGYIDYGGPDDPVVRGSLVRLDDSATVAWRVMLIRGSVYDLMKASRDDPIYRKGVTASAIALHLRERRRVNHPDGGAGIITKFGEPGLVGGPGHQLVLREIGVTWLAARELWRLQGGVGRRAGLTFRRLRQSQPSGELRRLGWSCWRCHCLSVGGRRCRSFVDSVRSARCFCAEVRGILGD